MSHPNEPNRFCEKTDEKVVNVKKSGIVLFDWEERDGTRSEDYLPSSELDLTPQEDDEASEEVRIGVIENASLFKCAFNIFKGNVGSAVFLLPTFYKDSGYIISPIIGLLIGSIVVDCSRLLVRAKTKVNRKSVSNYLELCDFVLGNPFRYVLLLALLLTQFGFCLLYLQLFGGSMAKLVPSFSGDDYVWMTVMFALVLPVSFFTDNLSFLAIISIIATICVFFALISTAVLSFMTLHEKGVEPSTTPFGTSVPLGWFNNMANNMMMLEGIGVVLPVENSCKNKPRFSLLLTVVLYLVVGWYLLYGLSGYLAHGEVLKVSLVDALDVNPFSIAVRVAFTVNIICTYPILFMPGILQLDSLLGWPPRSWKGILMRIVISLIIYGIAMGAGTGAVNIVVSLIGALPAVVMLIILPSLLSLCLENSVEEPHEPRVTWVYWRHNLFGRRCTLIRLRVYIYLCLGIVIMVVGTLSVVKGLVE
ncbi:putative amino acid permease 24 [Trypanosoma cruzi]|uniref:Amino acid transporter, putative n=2 Tax=Trypanosoma cruzi TaxID=5693 RepID=Q4DAV2_TRYCC|nr:amino acid transporter, putative [Trypanosoma cruzi]EAN89665.1 amino acid transporter, putative [Trypanosoma cruzi]PWU97411.1 putative amino acid permease 24 [Trypanosoma cruzi]|eukprot:XP_811516.1 amino acid transporter [Trypanosoma cruzi strain CL Brener]